MFSTTTKQDPYAHLFPNGFDRYKNRKIVFNCRGMFVTALFIIICIAGIALGGYQMMCFLRKQGGVPRHFVDLIYGMGSTYLHNIGLHKRETFEEYMILSAFIAYILINMIDLYVLGRAVFQPSFCAGKPPYLPILIPLIIVLALRAFIEIILWKYSVLKSVQNLFVSTFNCVVFNGLIYIYYTRDDDEVSVDGNCKPWVYEPLGLIK